MEEEKEPKEVKQPEPPKDKKKSVFWRREKEIEKWQD